MGVRVALSVVAAVLSVAFVEGGAATSHPFSFRTFISAEIGKPLGIAAGPDRAVWFTSEDAQSIGRITASGSVTRHPVAATVLGAIANGGDGALWFSEAGSLGRMLPDGATNAYPGAGGQSIAAGGDGSQWFTTGGKAVGRVAADGTVTTFASDKLRGTYGIARGPDGAMWVTNYLGSSVARIDASGSITTFTAPCVQFPTGITAGPDGALWFADDSGAIDRISPSGTITCFGGASSVGHPDAIVAGGDGALWAADRGGSIVRMTIHGSVTRYTTPAMRFPNSIAAGPKGTVWFTDYGAGSIGEIADSGQRTRSAQLKPLPKVTLISDSVAASIAFDVGAASTLADGIDLFLEPGQARTLGPAPPGGIAPPTLLDLVAEFGRRLGPTVVVEIGYNDVASTYAANMQAALSALEAAGVQHVLWLTLHETPDHAGDAIMNQAIIAAAARDPRLTVLDWNAYTSTHPEWFQPDGVHLTGDGPRALAAFVHAGLVNAGILARPAR